MKNLNEIKDNIFKNKFLIDLLNQLNENEKKQTMEVIDSLLNTVISNGGNLIKAVEEASKKQADK